MKTVGVSITHNPGGAGRVASLHRLISQLPGWPTHIESDPGRPFEWSERQWRGAIALGQEYCLLLNDDMTLCEGFADVLQAVIEARPDHILHLYNNHEMAKMAQFKQLRWVTSCDGLFGNAYLMPTRRLAEFLVWRATAPISGFVERCSEDNLLNLWCMSRRALIWHAVPALCDHDIAIPTCFEGNLRHTAVVPPRDRMPRDGWDTDAAHIGRYYVGSHYYLVTKMQEPQLERYWELCAEAG